MQKPTWAFMEVLEQLLQSWGLPAPSTGALGACFLTVEKNGFWGATASELKPLPFVLGRLGCGKVPAAEVTWLPRVLCPGI